MSTMNTLDNNLYHSPVVSCVVYEYKYFKVTSEFQYINISSQNISVTDQLIVQDQQIAECLINIGSLIRKVIHFDGKKINSAWTKYSESKHWPLK